MAVHADTGAAHIVDGKLSTDSGTMAAVLDTGKVAAAVWTSHAARTVLDTGIRDEVWVGDTGVRALILASDTGIIDSLTNKLDTGVPASVWDTLEASHTDTGTFGRLRVGVNVEKINGDTGAGLSLMEFSNVLSTTGQIDTGTGISDTGDLVDANWNSLRSEHVVSATFGRDLADSGKVAAVLDTGKVASAVWSSHSPRTLTASDNIDTGIAQAVWRQSRSTFTDTGAFGTGVDIHSIRSDTGHALQLGRFASVLAASGQIDTGTGVADTGDLVDANWNAADASHTDTGTFGRLRQGVNVTHLRDDTGAADRLFKLAGSKLSDSGTFDTGTIQVNAVVDTGEVAAAVWTSHQTRTLTASTNIDTGIAQAVWRELTVTFQADTGTFGEALFGGVDVSRILGDTGAVQRLLRFVGTKITDSGTFDTGTGFVAVGAIDDTGTTERLNAIETVTNQIVFTKANEVDSNIKSVNDVTVAGTGDTGTADTWRPA